MHVEHIIKKKSYETIEHVLRRHPISFAGPLGIFVVMFLTPIIVYFIINSFSEDALITSVYAPLIILAASAYYLFTLILFFSNFLDYYLDIWIVTNDRIIDIEQHGLFSRSVSEVDLFRIQDVTSDVAGVFSTLLNYGDVHVKTASSNADVVFRSIQDPNYIRERLIRLSHEDRKYHINIDQHL